MVDRLVRGRAWIPVLGVLLAGIVASQVEILKLGTSLGRSLDRTAALESQNQTLRAGAASLADAQRIEHLATGMGMVMPSPGLLTFVPASSQNQLRRAIANIHAPDPANFALLLASQATAAQLAVPTTPAASSGTSAGTATGAASTGVTGQTTPSSTTATGAAGTGGTGSYSTGGGSAGATGGSPGSGAAGSAGTGAAGAGPTTGAPSSTGTTGASNAPVAGGAPAGGGGAAAGAAGLPATTAPSGGSSGG